MAEMSKVANDEDLRVARQAKVWLNYHAAGAVDFRACRRG